MAKEIIETIRQAETAAAEKITLARAEADRIVSEARDAAKAFYSSEIKKANDEAEAKTAAAEERADKLVAEAQADAETAKAGLKAQAAARQAEAADAVIASLLLL